MFLIILGISILSYGLLQIWKCLRVGRMLSRFNGPECSSFICGNYDIFRAPPEILYWRLKSLYDNYSPNCYFRVFHVQVLMMFDPDDCEIFLSTTKHTKKSILYDVFRRWLNDGLLISSGEKWQKRRKILTPAFHFNILKDFIKVFNEKAEDFLSSLKNNCSEVINVVPELHEYSLSVIKETAMGDKEKDNDEDPKKYRTAVSQMEKMFNQYLVRPYLNNKLIYVFHPFYWQERKIVKVLHDYSKTIIGKKIKNAEEDNCQINDNDDDIYINKKKRRMVMLDILLEAKKNGNQIDYEGICEEVDTFMFEGHDTVSSALSFCMLTIANHPEIQNQILEEIHSILGENRQPTFEDLQNMNLLERCIKETLRLYPSVHLISRTVEEDTTLKSGQVVPKDTMILIPMLFIQRNPEIYPDPTKFDPDRFLPENTLNRHPYAYIPFSAGPRNCIGQRFAMLEMKVILSAVIRKFQLVAVDTLDSVELALGAILRSKDGIKVKFIPRS